MMKIFMLTMMVKTKTMIDVLIFPTFIIGMMRPVVKNG